VIECLAINPMATFLVIGLVLTLWILWRVQRSTKNIDFVDWWIGPDGKASWSKAAAMGGFCIGSWIVIYLTLHDKMTEMFFLFYFAICVGSPVAFAIVNSRTPQKEPT
jgi:hypothetical protein